MKKLFLLALALLCASASTPALAAGRDLQAEAEQRLRVGDLIGIWSCSGQDGRSDAVHARLRFGHSMDGGFWFALKPDDQSFVHPGVYERWVWHADAQTGYRSWETLAAKVSTDRVVYRSPGRQGDTVVWTRDSPRAPVSRTFRLLGPGRLSFVQRNGKGPGAQHVYDLTCSRTSASEVNTK